MRLARPSSNPSVSRFRIRGSSLIEVLIAVLIMGVGMLGIAAMQATALRNSQSSLERGQAVAHSYAILDAMRADRVAAMANAYNSAALLCAPPASDGSLANAGLADWISGLEATFGNSDSTCGQVQCDGADCTVTVQWDDSRGDDGVAAGDSEHQLITQAVL